MFMRAKTGFPNRNLKLRLSHARFLLSLILKPSKQDSAWGKVILVLVFNCGAGSAVGDGCQASAVALAGSAGGTLAETLIGNTKGALSGAAMAGKLSSARMP